MAGVVRGLTRHPVLNLQRFGNQLSRVVHSIAIAVNTAAQSSVIIRGHVPPLKVMPADLTSSQCSRYGIATDRNFCWIDYGDGKDESFT